MQSKTPFVGMIIWRGIGAHVIDGARLDPFECQPTTRGSYMFKADSGRGHFTDQMVAISAKFRFGLVCFVDEPPREPWTHFEVIRVHKNGKSVTVSAVRGDPEELYRQYDMSIDGFRGYKSLLPPLVTLNDVPLPV